MPKRKLQSSLNAKNILVTFFFFLKKDIVISLYRQGKQDWRRPENVKKKHNQQKRPGLLLQLHGSDDLKGVLDSMQELQKYASRAFLIVAVSNRLESCVCVVSNRLQTEREERKLLHSFDFLHSLSHGEPQTFTSAMCCIWKATFTQTSPGTE